MKKSLSSHGNSWDLHIDKPILMLLGFNPPEAKALLTLEGKVLYIRAVYGEEAEDLKNRGRYVRNFSKRGKGWGIPLPKSIIDMLEIEVGVDHVQLDVNGDILSVKKA